MDSGCCHVSRIYKVQNEPWYTLWHWPLELQSCCHSMESFCAQTLDPVWLNSPSLCPWWSTSQSNPYLSC